MSKIDLIEEDLWDHYSGLPNPTWYEFKNQLEDEEDDTFDEEYGKRSGEGKKLKKNKKLDLEMEDQDQDDFDDED